MDLTSSISLAVAQKKIHAVKFAGALKKLARAVALCYARPTIFLMPTQPLSKHSQMKLQNVFIKRLI